MKFFRFFKSEIKLEDEEPKKRQYLPFDQTYKIVTTCMVFGIMYPNKKSDNLRLATLVSIAASIAPVSFMIVLDCWNCFMRGEFTEVIRHSTVIMPFFVAAIKKFLMYFNREDIQLLIDEMNEDHEMFNHLPDSYHEMLDDHFKETLFFERAWSLVVYSCVMAFPLMGAFLTLFDCLTKEEPQKFMIHDVPIPFNDPQLRFESPWFEIMFVYEFYCSILYALNYTGYDGFYGIVMNHACLKMKLYCKALKDIIDENHDIDVIRQSVVDVIKAQVKVFDYTATVQRAFNTWLGMIFVGAVLHVCNCTYQITEGLGMDLKYLIFIVGSVIHIFLPCRHGTRLSSTSVETATLFYCCGWEKVNCQSVRKTIMFMIARAQTPLIITAFNMLTFDMDLFVSIMHTSYSMFTLLRE